MSKESLYTCAEIECLNVYSRLQLLLFISISCLRGLASKNTTYILMVFIGNCHALTIAPIVDECGGDKHKYLKDLKYHLSKTVPEYNDTFKLLLWCKEKKLMTVYNMIFDFSLFKLKEEMVRPRECLKKISKHMIVDLEAKNNRLNIHQHSSNLSIVRVESILNGIAKWIKALTALAEKASEES
ncbi:uncharacterized protein TRIADDRAFT_60730 [Trichoplax adhaerens]|uniref:Uncharacterized protein n=1 Tax=Trichoplax adhaerens TaxID=10228 RepID=B3S980_TRIAD|nr:predicted protein [Trichoplax adhaerens]EDV20755.1 predicted protein [Trichoplax adhaerens]|eukprot:XP_002116696.1 predicted protein [Trichoplax adhaerens]